MTIGEYFINGILMVIIKLVPIVGYCVMRNEVADFVGVQGLVWRLGLIN